MEYFWVIISIFFFYPGAFLVNLYEQPFVDSIIACDEDEIMVILFFILWLVLNGRFSLELVLLGIPISLAVCAFVVKVLGYSLQTEKKLLRGLPWFLEYLLNLIVEIGKASFSVAALAFNPKAAPEPVIVEFHSGLDSAIMNVILANSITLTPGTTTIFQKGDFFVVHCLRREYAQGLDESSFLRRLHLFPYIEFQLPRIPSLPVKK